MAKIKKFFILVAFVLMSVVCGLGLVSCGKETAPNAVDVNSIKIEDNVVTWDAVSGATSYIFTCESYTTSVYTNKCTVALSSSLSEMTIKIVAKNSAGESEEVGKVFMRLKTINAEDLTFDTNGIMTWNPVENATGYLVEINGTQVNNGSSTQFSEFSYGVNNVVRVKALGPDNTFSTFGTSTTRSFLGTPSNIRYDGETITWSGITSASSYNIYINGSLYASGVTTSSYNYAAQESTFTIAVQCEGNGTSTFSSKISDAVTCTKLDEVRNITVSEGKLVWDAVEHATAYQVRLSNGTAQTTTECNFAISSGVMYSVSIKPIADTSDFYFSTWSGSQNIYILNAPVLKWNTSLSLDGESQNSLYWDNTSEAGGYNIKVVTPSGQTETYTATTGAPHLSYAYLETGTYTVSVSAVSSEAGSYDSLYSTPLYIQRLAAPKLTVNNSISSDSTNYEAGFTVNYQSADGANRYTIYREGVSIGSTQTLSFKVTNILSENDTTGGEINYKIRSMGNTNDSTTIKLDSLTANATEFVVTVLPVPTDITMQGSTITWSTVSSASATGYAVKSDASITPVQQNSHSLQSIATGEHSISVCSVGNGENVLPSPYSTAIKVRKLAAPSNIRVNTTTDEGKLTWDGATGAHSYSVFFNGSSDGIDANNMENIKNYMQSGSNGVTLVMTAVADYYDTDGTYILSSDKSQTKQFIKLNTVIAAGAVISGYELTWRAPDNISTTASGKITYKVYDETNKVYATVDSARLDLTTLAGRLQKYTFSVMCVGDGEEFFNSEISDPIEITKLQEVSLSVNTTRNGYTWKGVANATSYIVKVGNDSVATVPHTGTGAYDLSSDQFATYMSAPGTYQVSIIAVGNADANIMDSTTTTINQTVIRLTAPVITTSYSEERVSTTGNILVSVTEAVAYANGYKYTFNGTVAGTIDNDARTCTYNAPSSGDYSVIATANGGLFDENGNFYMDSLTSTAVQITLLNSPSANTIEISRENVLTWTAVSGVTAKTGYTLILTYDDGTTETVTSGYATYEIAAGKDVKSVQISANGNGTTTISSKYVTKTFI